jgi:glycosyltransferase involved in cell wall biosynthesis
VTKRWRIAYRPFFHERAEKGYTFLMREAFAAFGEVVRDDGVFGTWRRFGRLDAIVLNWSDNDLLDRRTRSVASRKVARLFARTVALRLIARRLIFVRHNVYPHATASGREGDAQRWVDRYERLFDVVLSHSGDPAQASRRYCPHPLYPRVASDDVALPFEVPRRYFVVFGRIVRYKRIERLIAAWPSDATLVVAGAAGDRAYADELRAMAPPQVFVHAGLVDETVAQALVARSAGLVMAHADADVVVSSSFYFAMSLGVPVLAVETPFLRWIAPRLDQGLVTLAPDVESLVAKLDDARAPLSNEAIEREFGRATVVRCLAVALDRPPG